MKRREFFKAAAICGAASALPSALAQKKTTSTEENSSMNQIPLASSAGTRKGDMLYRTLGRTAKHPDWLGGDTPGVQALAPSS
jgi:hypothetical protein